jgi:hypothetical protein
MAKLKPPMQNLLEAASATIQMKIEHSECSFSTLPRPSYCLA